MADHFATFANPRIRDEIADRISEEAESGWVIEHQLTPEDRTATLRAVFLDSQARWVSAFAVMLLLATGVATFGLSQNSAATIIGAMIIAPLGQPIVALGASLAMVWSRESLRMLLVIAFGALAVVTLAYLLNLPMPDGPVNEQTLARTAPGLRDLGVALLAGAAGAYAYVRDELSGVLPGVAIAVALVPPLAVVGMMLEEGHTTLALGALTLFAANLVGIAFAAGVVMLLTGFAPAPKLRRSPRALATLVIALASVAAISWPLGRGVVTQVRRAYEVAAAHRIAQRDIVAGGGTVRSVQVVGRDVTITVDDTTRVGRRLLQEDMARILGPSAGVTLVQER